MILLRRREMGNRSICPIFFVAQAHYTPQKIEELSSIFHSLRYEPLNQTGSWPEAGER